MQMQWSVEVVEYGGKVVDDLRRDHAIPVDFETIMEYAQGVYEYYTEEGYDDVPAPGLLAAYVAESLRNTGELAPEDCGRDFIFELVSGQIPTEKPPVKGWRGQEVDERGGVMFKYQILRKGGLPLVFIGEPLGQVADDIGEAKLYRTRHGRYVPVVSVLGVTYSEPKDSLEDAMAFIMAHSEVLGKALAAKLGGQSVVEGPEQGSEAGCAQGG